MWRASRVSPETLYFFGDVIVDFFKTEITRCSEKIMVTTKEFKTLEFLTKTPSASRDTYRSWTTSNSSWISNSLRSAEWSGI